MLDKIFYETGMLTAYKNTVEDLKKRGYKPTPDKEPDEKSIESLLTVYILLTKSIADKIKADEALLKTMMGTKNEKPKDK